MLRNRRYGIYVGLITLAVLLVGSIIWNSGTQRLSAGAADLTIESWYRGSDDAPVRIDLFTDFKCSICLDKERMAFRAFEVFGESAQLVYHHYPDTPVSELVAEALEAAGEQGKFWELHDRLIDDTSGDIYQVIHAAEMIGLNTEEYAISKIMTEAENIGANTTQIIEALGNGRFIQKVRNAKQEAESIGVDHVSVFINGKEFTKYPATPDEFFAAVRKELGKQEAAGVD